MPLNKKLLFLTEPSQLDCISNDLLASSRIIAVTPHIAFALDQRTIPYSTPENYIGLDEINRIGTACNEQFDTFHASVLRHITHPFFAEHPLLNIYYFQRLYTTITVAVRTLSAIISKEQPEEIMYMPNIGGNNEQNEEFIYWEKSLYAILLPLFSSKCKITPLFYENTVMLTPPPKIVYNRVSPKVFTPIVPWHIKKTAQYNILILDLKYNLPYLIDICRNNPECNLFVLDLYGNSTWEIFFNNHEIITQNPDYIAIKNEMKILWESLEKNTFFKSLFSIGGLDTWIAFKPHIDYFITDSLPKSYVIHDAVSKLHAEHPIDCVVSSFTVPFIHSFETIFNWARQSSVPSVVYQHGGAFGYIFRQAHNRTDFHLPDYFFGFGDGVKQYAQKYCLRSTVIPVGSPMIESHASYSHSRTHLIERIPRFDHTKKTVGYISTAFHGTVHHNPSDIYPDHLYFELQKEMLELFRKTANVQFLIKTFPKRYSQITREYVLSLNAPNIIIADQSVQELHALVDVYVLDFISTILLQTIASKKPVVMYYDQRTCPLEPDALKLLKKRIHYSESFEQFAEDLKYVLSSPDDPFCSNDEFYTSYIAPELDGKSGLRAYNALLDICKKYKRIQPQNTLETIGLHSR